MATASKYIRKNFEKSKKGEDEELRKAHKKESKNGEKTQQ